MEADEIFVIKNGKVAEKGSLASSIDEGNIYLKVGNSDTSWSKILTDVMNSFNYAPTGNVKLFGFEIKWGVVTSTAGGTVINFPSSFANACYIVIPTHDVTNGSAVTPVSAYNIGRSGFTLSVNGGGSVPVRYIAIGY
jgi:hypothetical protein